MGHEARATTGGRQRVATLQGMHVHGAIPPYGCVFIVGGTQFLWLLYGFVFFEGTHFFVAFIWVFFEGTHFLWLLYGFVFFEGTIFLWLSYWCFLRVPWVSFVVGTHFLWLSYVFLRVPIFGGFHIVVFLRVPWGSFVAGTHFLWLSYECCVFEGTHFWWLSYGCLLLREGGHLFVALKKNQRAPPSFGVHYSETHPYWFSHPLPRQEPVPSTFSGE